MLILADMYMVGRKGQLKYYQLKAWKHYQNHSMLLVNVKNNVVENVNVLKTIFCVLSLQIQIFFQVETSHLVKYQRSHIASL